MTTSQRLSIKSTGQSFTKHPVTSNNFPQSQGRKMPSKGISLIQDLTTDLGQYKNELQKLNCDQLDVSKSISSRCRTPDPQIRVDDNKQPTGITQNQNLSVEREFQKTVKKQSPLEYHYDIKILTAPKKDSRPSLPVRADDPSVTNNQIDTLRRNYNKLFNESMQMRKNRVEWKEYDRVRAENGELRGKMIQLNQEVIRQRKQILSSKCDLQNFKSIDLRRMETENKYLREQLSKIREGAVGFEATRLRMEKQNLEGQLKQAKIIIDKHDRSLQLSKEIEGRGFYAGSFPKKSQVDFQQQLSALRDVNASILVQLEKSCSHQKQHQNQIDEFKSQIASLEALVNTLQSEKNSINLRGFQLSNQNQNLVLQRQSLDSNGDVIRLRQEKRELIYQLDEKAREICFLKTKIKDLAESYIQRQDIDANAYKQKVRAVQRQLQLSHKGDQSSVNMFDEVIRTQVVQNHKFRQTLQNKSEELYALQQQLVVLRSLAENAKCELQVERVKFLVEKKNSSSIWQAQKQNLMGQENILRKQIQTLQEKVKHVMQENRKKDEFMKSHLIGKTNDGDIKVFIEIFFQEYKQVFG